MFSRFANKLWSIPRQAGTAIIMAMLTVALVAGIAATILADYGHAVDQLSGRHDQAQARWLARGAVDWARNVLESAHIRGGANRVDHLHQEWAIKVPSTPFEEGELSGELEELSGRFNLNSLVSTTGTVDADQFLRFERLLVALGFSQYQADQLGGAVVDWIDPDDNQYGQRGASELSSYHKGGANVRVPTNDYILDINELQFIHGFTPAVIQTLLPHVAALPASARLINVNTASGPVLQAYVEKLTAAQANALVLDRERAFFTSVEDFQQRLPSQAAPATALLKVTSTYFYATGRAHWGDAVTRMQVLLERQQARPDILWIKIQ